MSAARKRPAKGRPIEYSILYTATLCMLAAGAVMVYSASSAESLLQGTGDAAFYLKRYVIFGLIGLGLMHYLSRHGLKAVKNVTPLLLVSSFVLCIAVMVPGVGVTVNGATRWLGAGPVQFQPSEVLKIALVLYAAQLLAARPKRLLTLGGLCKPLLIVVGAAWLILLKQPDMGTAPVPSIAPGGLLIGAGAGPRQVGAVFGGLGLFARFLAIAEPYRRDRLMSFLDPWAHKADEGFQ